MKRLSKMLKLVAIGLLLVSGSTVAEKTSISDCPCWDTDPGLQDAVQTIERETCVVYLEKFKEFLAPDWKNWYLWVRTVPDTVCLQFQVQQGDENRCTLRVGTSDLYSHCMGGEWTIVTGISDTEVRSCKRALNEAEDYLSVLAMCE
jgi:hypothetical protein